MKAKRVILWILIVVLFLAAFYAIFKLASGLLFSKKTEDVQVVDVSPDAVEPTADPVLMPEPENNNAEENTINVADETPEPPAETTSPESTDSNDNSGSPDENEVEVTPQTSVIIVEDKGEIEIIVPEDQESAGE